LDNLQKLKKSHKSSEEPTREEIVEALLEETETAGRVPTDESRLLDYLQLRQLSFDFAQDVDILARAPSVPHKLRAALSLNHQTIVTHSGLDSKRCRFSILHEIGHFVLPEHRDRLFLDTDATLSWWTKMRLEKEANEVAADLIFQGNRFTEEASDHPLSCKTVLELAPNYGASYESAMRRYVERHELPCAVIVYNKVLSSSEDSDLGDEQYQIHYVVTSPIFRDYYFSSVESNESFSKGSDIYKVHGSWNIGNVVESDLVVEHGSKEPWRFQTELFTNGYKIFQCIVRPLQPGAHQN
jgi:Zn-dependent peptidase ImmA (M78 family)